MQTRQIAISILLAAAGLASSARADDACAADRDKLCKESKGRRAKAACMKSHESELSDACKAQRAAMTQAAEEVHADCKPDVDKLCKGVEPGRGRIRACLKSHQSDLSPACQQAIASIKAMKEKIHPDCQPDVDKLCAAIAPGDGRVLACLQSHETDLSAACKGRVEKRLSKKAAKTPAK